MTARRLDLLTARERPLYAIWELTLACDQPCTHCASRAGTARASELSRERALEVVAEIAAMGTKEIGLIGGEAYLHDSFLDIVAEIKKHGMRATMTTGGRGISRELAQEMFARGMDSVSVSVDGLAPTHDLMRASRGSYAAAMSALSHLDEAGISTGANTNVNRLNASDLEPLYEALRDARIRAWQVQLTAPMGRAADRPDLIIQPWDLLDIIPRVARLKERAFADGILLMAGNNLGYFGPEEARLRSVSEDGKDHYRGCLAGRYQMGIESDGTIKGCPSLQTTHYAGGNLKEQSIESIWQSSPQLAFSRVRTTESLWGFCKTCPFAETCMAGCTFTAHALMGRPGNNPYCHFRARSFAKEGKRERLLRVAAPPGHPFDNGRFEIEVEPLDAPDVRPERAVDLVKLRRK